jgi:hypothetical protein
MHPPRTERLFPRNRCITLGVVSRRFDAPLLAAGRHPQFGALLLVGFEEFFPCWLSLAR